MKGHRILIVDDQLERGQQLRRLLSDHSYSAQRVGGKRATEAFKDDSWDLVIVHHSAEGMADQSLLGSLRKVAGSIRMLLLTPTGQLSEFLQPLPNYMFACMEEDVEPASLLRYVDQTLHLADSVQNRRGYSRYMLAMDTHLILINPFNDSESRPVAGLIRDVSRSGLSMLVRRLLPVPAMLKLVIDLPGSNQSITMLAKSISCTLTQIPNVYRLGVKFVGLLPNELEHAITDMEAEGHISGEGDIYLGKTFKNALEEWLKTHQADVETSGPLDAPPELARRLSSIADDFPHED